ncbi:MAG TPA: PqqD family protein [Gemmatimonadales bacterium]|jgi:hypothetical protein
MTTRYTLHPELRLTRLGDEGVALHLGSRRYFTVSETGVDILEALKTPSTLADIVARLTSSYDVTPELAEKSARDFLDNGRRHGLLHVEDAP